MTNTDWISESARRNPEGLLLLAAGVALLLRNSSSSSASRMRSRREQAPSYGDGDETHGRSEARRSVGRYATQVRDSVSETTAAVAESASEYASTAQEYIEDAGRRIADRSSEYASRAQSTVQQNIDRIVREQPFAIAVAGLAAGAAVAAAFPATQMERNSLGPAGEQLTAAAAAAKRKAGEAVSAAGSELKRVADAKGLNVEGLQEVAQEIGEKVGDALEGSGSSSANAYASTPSGTYGSGYPSPGEAGRGRI